MADLREDLKKKKPVLGLERALKKIRNKKVSRIYVASTSHAKDDLARLGKSMGAEVVFVDENAKELGIICKKSFSISVISFE